PRLAESDCLHDDRVGYLYCRLHGREPSGTAHSVPERSTLSVEAGGLVIRPTRVFRILQNLARRRIGLDPAHGTSLSHDLRRLAPGFRARMIFDVGANKGQTAVEFLSAFPGATIHSFEPVLRTFR